MRVRLSRRAQADLVSIGEWIGGDDPHRAATFVDELLDGCELLADFPEAYSRLERFAPRNVRSKVHSPYRIVHEVLEHEVIVLAFVHGARDIDALDL